MQTKNKLNTLLKLKNILEPDSEKHLPLSKFKIPIPSIRPASDFKTQVSIKPAVKPAPKPAPKPESTLAIETVKNTDDIPTSIITLPENQQTIGGLNKDSYEQYKEMH